MYEIQTRMHLDRLSGREVFDFLVNLDNSCYQAWWPGTHLEFHYIKRSANHVGSLIYMDEFIGERRVKIRGVIKEATPGKRIVWQAQKLIRLPVIISLELQDDEAGTKIIHIVRVGYDGIGRVFDPLLRLYISQKFARAIDDHVKNEFAKLTGILQSTGA